MADLIPLPLGYVGGKQWGRDTGSTSWTEPLEHEIARARSEHNNRQRAAEVRKRASSYQKLRAVEQALETYQAAIDQLKNDIANLEVISVDGTFYDPFNHWTGSENIDFPDPPVHISVYSGALEYATSTLNTKDDFELIDGLTRDSSFADGVVSSEVRAFHDAPLNALSPSERAPQATNGTKVAVWEPGLTFAFPLWKNLLPLVAQKRLWILVEHPADWQPFTSKPKNLRLSKKDRDLGYKAYGPAAIYPLFATERRWTSVLRYDLGKRNSRLFRPVVAFGSSSPKEQIDVFVKKASGYAKTAQGYVKQYKWVQDKEATRKRAAALDIRFSGIALAPDLARLAKLLLENAAPAVYAPAPELKTSANLQSPTGRLVLGYHSENTLTAQYVLDYVGYDVAAEPATWRYYFEAAVNGENPRESLRTRTE